MSPASAVLWSFLAGLLALLLIPGRGPAPAAERFPAALAVLLAAALGLALADTLADRLPFHNPFSATLFVRVLALAPPLALAFILDSRLWAPRRNWQSWLPTASGALLLVLARVWTSEDREALGELLFGRWLDIALPDLALAAFASILLTLAGYLAQRRSGRDETLPHLAVAAVILLPLLGVLPVAACWLAAGRKLRCSLPSLTLSARKLLCAALAISLLLAALADLPAGYTVIVTGGLVLALCRPESAEAGSPSRPVVNSRLTSRPSNRSRPKPPPADHAASKTRDA